MVLPDLDRSIKALLDSEIERVQRSEVAVYFDQPTQRWKERLGNQPSINLFLYDVRENHILRQHQWQEQLPETDHHTGRRQKRTPFRVDCTYILTVWANTPEDEHHLLSECMMALFRYPVLPDDVLQGVLTEQPFEIATRLASHDKLTNPAELWSALDNQLRPSITYTVTVAFDPWKAEDMREEQPVRTVTADMVDRGSGEVPLHQLDGLSHRIGGVVLRGDVPLARVQVRVMGGGRTAVTNENGRYFLGPLSAGVYTLQAWQNDTLLAQKSVNVPRRSVEETYDFILE
jgi:hypothetical protein